MWSQRHLQCSKRPADRTGRLLNCFQHQALAELVTQPAYLLHSCHIGVCCQLHISDIDKRGLVRVTGQATEEVLEVMIACWASDK